MGSSPLCGTRTLCPENSLWGRWSPPLGEAQELEKGEKQEQTGSQGFSRRRPPGGDGGGVEFVAKQGGPDGAVPQQQEKMTEDEQPKDAHWQPLVCVGLGRDRDWGWAGVPTPTSEGVKAGDSYDSYQATGRVRESIGALSFIPIHSQAR